MRGDPVRLRQVLLNLVGNAVKFTETGQVVIRARSLDDDQGSVAVRFDVIDTGIGIDPASQDLLFVSFSQADTSTTRRYGGTGLGLALAKRLVELMGGEIGVESTPGEGSAFWFTVRMAKSAAEAASPETMGWLEGVRALIVDDNETNGLILERQLRTWAMRPETVQDPRQALEILRLAADAGEPFGVALVDMEMPHMDGLEVAEAVDREVALAGLPVVLLSSAVTLARADGTRAGVSLVLMKPVRQSELYDALIRVLAPEVAQTPLPESGHPRPTLLAGWRGEVLVVEDNVINQAVATGTLTKLGYRTHVASNGREAMEALASHEYVAVLMDCQMPEVDGYQATQEIRRWEGGEHHVPIIAMPASAMMGDRERCLAAGMDDYIPKPVRAKDIEVVLERWVAGGPGGASDGDSPRPTEDVLDSSLLEQLRDLGTTDDGGDLFAELVEIFVNQSAIRLEELRDAVERGDCPALSRAAHTQRGSSASVGAASLASACVVLEAAAEKADIGEARKGLQQLEAELERATAALRSEAHLS